MGDKAVVTVSLGRTINMGDYQTGRVDIGVSMPCEPNMKAVNETYETLAEEVENMMKAEVERIPVKKG